MFLRQKTFTNKDGSKRIYAQLCHSKKVGGVSQHTVLLDLGRIDLEEGKQKINQLISVLLKASDTMSLLDICKDFKAENTLEYGTHFIFSKIWQRLGLNQVLGSSFKEKGCEFDIIEAIYNMTLNRLSAPSSKRGLEPWQQSMYGINTFDTHQYYRAMDYLIENKDIIEKKIFDSQRDLFSQAVDVVLFDTTTIVYYGDKSQDEYEKLLAKGFSKDHRPDLNQVVVGVLISKKGVPLGHEVFSGNTNDVSCFKEIIDKVSLKFKISRVVLVGDRGMISGKNLANLKDRGYHYILGYKMRTICKQDRAKVLSKADLKKIKKDELTCKEVVYQGERLIVFYNPERAKLDAQRRAEVIEKIQEKLKCGDVKTLFSNQNYKKFVTVDAAAPELDVTKVEEDAIYDGIFVITSNTDLKPLEVIEGYRDLWQVEMAFRQLKSELRMGPMYHQKDQRIRAHIMICFLSLMMRSEFYRLLKSKYKKASYPQVLADIKLMRVVSLEVKSEKVHIRTETRPGMMQAIKSLKLRSPARVLSHETSKSLIS